MKHSYNYNSYTTKPNVNLYYPIISKESILNSHLKHNKLKEVEKKSITIEEYAEIIIKNTEEKRGYKYPSIERRKLKKQVIKDIKRGKYKIN